MTNTLRKILVGTALIGGLAGCENEKPIQEAVVTNESFYPKVAFNGSDRYTALLKFADGQEGYMAYYDDEARVLDLRYDIGDTVKVRRHIKDHYVVVDNPEK